jgi:hypothetical protein
MRRSPPRGYAFDDCDFEGECYGGLDRTTSTCVLVQNLAAWPVLRSFISTQTRL